MCASFQVIGRASSQTAVKHPGSKRASVAVNCQQPLKNRSIGDTKDGKVLLSQDIMPPVLPVVLRTGLAPDVSIRLSKEYLALFRCAPGSTCNNSGRETRCADDFLHDTHVAFKHSVPVFLINGDVLDIWDFALLRSRRSVCRKAGCFAGMFFWGVLETGFRERGIDVECRILSKSFRPYGWGSAHYLRENWEFQNPFHGTRASSSIHSSIPIVCRVALCHRKNIYGYRHHALESHCLQRCQGLGQGRNESGPHSVHVYKQASSNKNGLGGGVDMVSKTAVVYRLVGWLGCYATGPGQKRSLHNGHVSGRETLPLSRIWSQASGLVQWCGSAEGLIFRFFYF